MSSFLRRCGLTLITLAVTVALTVARSRPTPSAAFVDDDPIAVGVPMGSARELIEKQHRSATPLPSARIVLRVEALLDLVRFPAPLTSPIHRLGDDTHNATGPPARS